MKNQNELFRNPIFPKTRYQGSKYKLLSWIRQELEHIEFESAVDAFSGTSSVSYSMKEMGKRVHSNDIMPCNFHVANSLIKNSSNFISQDDYHSVLQKDSTKNYKSFITDTFEHIYYLDHENEWLDIVVQNILDLKDSEKKSMFFWALYQACISKRPYNLFHRKNLYIRLSNVERSFGNKATWDKPFAVHFQKFITQINNAVFCNKKENTVSCLDSKHISHNADLIYIDPPYIPIRGSLTLYNDFYHFLNGMTEYHNWGHIIDYQSKNLKLKSQRSAWECKENISNEFLNLIELNQDKKIVISYRNDGILSIDVLVDFLKKIGKKVKVCEHDYSYILSKTKTKENLIIGV